ncbi:ABC transporter ATP-binding protein [Salinirubrum litoreum]|uniref:ATP-binding cassette domain-containing protein n=1 Tax=Salinirubrum litoreum TaxID=1126234 RepID=A0ABD5RH30_9EURY|nr:ABC transporter ATP-binding protein [Salinirubrum litoreum]
MPSTPAIEFDSISKQFGDVTALHDLDLTVEEGEIYGFLGPNGAGKSTAINILLGFLPPTDGQATVLGYGTQTESTTLRQHLGVLPEGYQVYGRLTGREHLEVAAESKGATPEYDRLLDRVGIREAADRKAGTYSKGMTQRLVFGMALVGEPDLLILDEPSSGLDPNGAKEMREIILEENDRGTTVFFSSHILSQVEAVCDRVGILRAGSLIAEDSIQGLRQTVDTGDVLTVSLDSVTDDCVTAVETLDGVSDVQTERRELTVTLDGGSKTAVLQALESTGAEVRDFSTEEKSLEELFTAYTEPEGRSA